MQRDIEQRKQRLLKWANLLIEGEPRTFANFEPRPGTELALTAAQNFTREVRYDEVGNVYVNGTRHEGPLSTHSMLVLVGRNGCGKSHLLEAIARVELELTNYSTLVRYEYVPTLLDDLRAAYDEDAEVKFEEKWGTYRRANLLLLDDIGTEKYSEWAREKLTTLVDERYRYGKRLVVATNLGFDEMATHLGYRIADRLFDEHTGKVLTIQMTCNSYRTGKSWGVPKGKDRR